MQNPGQKELLISIPFLWCFAFCSLLILLDHVGMPAEKGPEHSQPCTPWTGVSLQGSGAGFGSCCVGLSLMQAQSFCRVTKADGVWEEVLVKEGRVALRWAVGHQPALWFLLGTRHMKCTEKILYIFFALS